jgi:hypothetical protein
MVRTRFTGAPSFDQNGEPYIPHPDPLRYVGDPVKYPEIDKNWNKLVFGKRILLENKLFRMITTYNYTEKIHRKIFQDH